MEFDVLPNLKDVGLAVVGRLRDFGAEVADEFRGIRRVLRVDADQDAVERRDRMHRCVGALAMAVKARRRIGRDHIGEGAAVLRLIIGQPRCGKRRRAKQHHQHFR